MGVTTGVMLALTANLSTAIALVLQKKLPVNGNDAETCRVGHSVLGTEHPSILLGVGNGDLMTTSLARWASVIAYIMLGLGYVLDIMCLEYLSLSAVGALSASQLIFSTMLGYVFLEESLSGCGGVGVMFIIGGCVAIVTASDGAKGGNYDEGLLIWITSTTVIISATVACATLHERVWPRTGKFEGLTSVAKRTLLTLPWLFAFVSGLSAADTLLLSKMLLDVETTNSHILLVCAIGVEIMVQVYLLKSAFVMAAYPGLAFPDPCMVVASTFAVMTVVFSTLSAGVVYGEFHEYSSVSWGLTGGGLVTTILGLCFLRGVYGNGNGN